jgi:hypothetical protein
VEALWLHAGRDQAPRTLREIAKEVGCCAATVLCDIREIRKGWAERRVTDAAAELDGHLAELKAARRLAWSQKKPDSIVRNLEREAKMLGLEPTPPETVPLEAVQALAEQLAAVVLPFVPEEKHDELRAAIAQVPLRD